MRGALGILITSIALLAMGGGSASAAVICVPDEDVDSSCTEELSQGSFDAALGAAQASTGVDDEILLGAGTWPVTGVYNPSASNNRLAISGAPSTDPSDVVITRASAGGTLLEFYEANVELRNLTVRATSNGQRLVASEAPLLTVDNVIFETNGAVTGSTGMDIQGTGSLDLSNSSIDLGASSNNCLTSLDTAGNVAVSATDIEHCARGLEIRGAGFTGDRVRVSHSTQVAMSLLNGTGALTNSLLVDNQGVTGFVELGADVGDINYTISHSTIVNASNSQEYGVLVYMPSGDSNVRFYDTIVSGPYYSAGIRCNQFGTANVATITTDYFASDGINRHGGTTDCAISQDHSYGDTPGFLNSGGNPYQLAPGSPLIDQDPAVLDPFRPLDLLGNARFRGCKQDLGAYEAVGAACPLTPPPPAAIAAAPAITGKLKAIKSKKGKKAKLAYSLSAPVKVSFSAKPKKGKKPKSKSLGSQQGKAGKNTFSFKVKLKKGKYTLTVTPAGGVPKTTTLTVK